MWGSWLGLIGCTGADPVEPEVVLPPAWVAAPSLAPCAAEAPAELLEVAWPDAPIDPAPVSDGLGEPTEIGVAVDGDGETGLHASR